MHSIFVRVNPDKALSGLSSALRADFAANCKIWVKVQDPEQKFAVMGEDGQLGATFSWEGVKEKVKVHKK